ncbi:hypothetical protein BH23THE1_BH23THE1_27520 [soil metagenome]
MRNIKDEYLVQPYPVGPKNSKSMAIIIPSPIVKKFSINPSTGFVMKYDNLGISLQYLDKRPNGFVSDDLNSLATLDHQISSVRRNE